MSIRTLVETAVPDRTAIGDPDGLTYAGLRDRATRAAARVPAADARSAGFAGHGPDAGPPLTAHPATTMSEGAS